MSSPSPQVTQTSSVPVVPGAARQLGQNLVGLGEAFTGGPAQIPEEFQFRDISEQFPGGVNLGLRPQEEALRQEAIGGFTGQQQAVDVGRERAVGSLLAPRTGGEEIAGQTLRSTAGGEFLSQESNPFLQEQISTINRNLQRNIANIASRAGVAGAGGGTREAVLQGVAAGETSGQIGDLLAANFARERGLQQGAVDPLLRFEQQPTQDELTALGVEQQFGAPEATIRAAELESIPREISQANRDVEVQEQLRQQSERLLPVQVGQSILGQRIGQSVPVVSPAQSPLAGLGSLFSGLGNLGGIFGGK